MLSDSIKRGKIDNASWASMERKENLMDFICNANQFTKPFVTLHYNLPLIPKYSSWQST